MSYNRVVLLRGINDFNLEKLEVPKPGTGEIVIKVECSGLCPSDIKIIRYGSSLLRYPVVLGHETAGEIYAVGDDVTEVKIGEKVNIAADIFCGICKNCREGRENLCENPLSFGYNVNGSHADYMLVPKKGVPRAVFKIPDGLSTELATLTEPFACVVHSMNVSGASPGKKVAVIGDGPMALMHVILSKIYGISSISVLGLHDKKLKIAQDLGADKVYNRKKYKNINEIIKENLEGFDSVYLTVVNKETLEEAFKLVNKGGYVVVFAGVPSHSVSYTLDPNLIHYNEVSLIGSFGYTYVEYSKALKLLSEHQELVSKIISHRFKIEDFKEAVSAWDDKDKSIKIMITR